MSAMQWRGPYSACAAQKPDSLGLRVSPEVWAHAGLKEEIESAYAEVYFAKEVRNGRNFLFWSCMLHSIHDRSVCLILDLPFSGL